MIYDWTTNDALLWSANGQINARDLALITALLDALQMMYRHAMVGTYRRPNACSYLSDLARNQAHVDAVMCDAYRSKLTKTITQTIYAIYSYIE